MIDGLVSIITPTFNSANFIEETIESVLSQTYHNWEMIIVDDCSSDNTEEVVNQYVIKDNRIKYIKLDKNSGAAVARNKAMAEAKGEYMAFLDSDDVWTAEKLSEQLSFMHENSISFSCTDYEQISESGEKTDRIIKTLPKANYNRILLDCPVGNSTVMYSVRELGKFEVPDIRKRNDDALWLQILKKTEYIYGLNQVLMQYRIRNNSISSNKISLIKYHWELYREIESLSRIRSAFHIFLWGVIKILKIK
ncbi:MULTISPECIES: glycosyltransferase family 2 protein [Streptococcus]|uniref:glycosyltransferase family 2 protein n=1 Tax=Streptococcus TaxID=1301 RepID=UPI000660E40B|nr:glycosyltransferase family 2 protein [Streptococcus cristatus]